MGWLLRLVTGAPLVVGAPDSSRVEVCMGMGKTGIPWDSHGNGSKISHGMGMGSKCMGMGVKTWELEKTLHTVTSKHLQQCLC